MKKTHERTGTSAHPEKNVVGRRAVVAGALVAPFVLGAAARAQEYPARPIQIIVPFGPGGSGDISARLFAQFLEQKWKQPVTVINRPGANGLIGTSALKAAAPDGYTIGIASSSTHPAAPLLFKEVPYDWVNDFTHIGLVGVVGSVLVVRSENPIKALPELVAHAKANPGKVFFGYFNTTSQIPAEIFKVRADLAIEGVAYKAIGNAVSDLLGGQIDFMFVDYVAASSHIASGKLRPLAITEVARRPAWPDVPTMGEFYPGYDFKGYVAVTAPAKVPKEIAERLNEALREAERTPEVRRRLEELGFTLRDYSLAQYNDFVLAEGRAWSEYVKIAKLTPQ